MWPFLTVCIVEWCATECLAVYQLFVFSFERFGNPFRINFFHERLNVPATRSKLLKELFERFGYPFGIIRMREPFGRFGLTRSEYSITRSAVRLHPFKRLDNPFATL